ncbi:FAD-linked oxidase C-terminal domain-containing protein [Aureisphaera galaxeae]|uniref:FAD-binding and (Fe-S)-binding domain-containing protein n=1 Tax=Aureisphaera galaxeae TaxID=1538023 RepID=UPI0023503B5B|nr:FAD-binding and (Fe-S)-binding domain-containing protein [Aureisphaera galaxeae]MDC8004191.1 FAD-linked oxidase C-terminal domain-containing protein [Aureisphaera galaxeae]
MIKHLQRFQATFEGDFHFDDLHKTLYATDASVYRKLPLAVAFPKKTQALQQLIAFANEHKTSLVPRTAGTSLAGQCVGEGIIVDVSKYFTQIVKVDKDQKTVTVQPGVIRDELNTYLQPYGLFFGPNTSTSNRCMIGGMVGNNSSGTTSIKYGVTRDKIVSMKVLLSNGAAVEFSSIPSETFVSKAKKDSLEGSIYEVLLDQLSQETIQEEIQKEFPKPEIHRRNTGYAVDALLKSELFGGAEKEVNLCALLSGSEGTLAFTTEITLQLDDLPPPLSAMVVPQYETLEHCLNDVQVAMEHSLYTCEMMDDVILKCTENNKKYDPYRFFVSGDPKALLMLEVRAYTEEELERKTKELLVSLKQSGNGYVAPVLMRQEIDMAMELRKAGLGLLGNMVGDKKAVACIEDTAVALEDLPNFISEFTQIMKDHGQVAVYYAHAGAGELHLRPILNLKTIEGVDYFRKITTDVAKLTKKFRGSFSGEHGDGIVRAEFLEMQIGSKNFELLKKIKKTFDPENIFNPGKITDAWPMDASLRTAVDKETPKVSTLMDFSDSEGIVRLAEKCNGSGDCRKTEKSNGAMCPSYHATKDEKDTTRARANRLREVLNDSSKANRFDDSGLKEVFDLCISCKSCASECPSNVDIAVAKSEFQYQYAKTNGRKRSDGFFGKSTHYNKIAAKFPRVANALFKAPIVSGAIKNYMGVASNRTIPNISTNTFSKYIQSKQNQTVNENIIYLFVDEFCNYLDTEVAIDAYELLMGLGYQVEPIHDLDSARALFSKGYLDEAKEAVNKAISALKGKISTEHPLIGIEPSAILGFRDEFLRIADDKESANNIASNTFLIEEFLAQEFEKGRIAEEQFTDQELDLKLHIHCHQKALSNQKVTFDILNIPKNYSPKIITAGCCGMAGSFGYEKEHYDISMKIGELRLFPAVRKASKETVIVANGTSCRHQIKDGANRQALHPVTVLRNALL